MKKLIFYILCLALPKEIAFLRLDGDMYISTIDPLKALYPKLIHGG